MYIIQYKIISRLPACTNFISYEKQYEIRLKYYNISAIRLPVFCNSKKKKNVIHYICVLVLDSLYNIILYYYT